MLFFCFLCRVRYNKTKDEIKQETSTRTQEEINDYYYICEKDGYVIVYEGDQKTIYEQTSIRVEDLPDKIKQSVKKGIKVSSLGQIYGFLENYSS